MHKHSIRKSVATAAAAFIAGAAIGTQAYATEGYFQPGYDAIQKSLSGAGVANPEDSMTLAINPAGLTSIGQEFQVSLSFFSPYRKYSVTGGPGFVAPGTVNSGWRHFVLPTASYSQPIDANSSWGISLYGNGGMNTNYRGSTPNPACGPFSGVYCGGKAGVNLSQVFISPGYARKFGDLSIGGRSIGDVSIGIAPIFAVQMFEAKGLGAFAAISAHPNQLTNKSISYSFGGGARIGVLWSATPTLRLAAAGTTPIFMSKFNKFKGLFPNGGRFDIPASVTAGLAWDALPGWTLMLDYKHIFYSSIAAVGRSTQFTGIPFGARGGPGFGWSDVNVGTVGVEWRVAPDWSLRAGYARNTNPVGPEDVTLNILAPGVIRNHISTGFSHRFGEHSNVDFSALYAPTSTVSGIEVTPFGPNPGRTIKLAMHQLDITIGYRYEF